METAIEWVTDIDFQPKYTSTFKPKSFHKSHSIRQWAIENVNVSNQAAVHKTENMCFQKSNEEFIDYLEEYKKLYNEKKDR